MNGLISLLKMAYLFGAPLFVPCYARYLQDRCGKLAAAERENKKTDRQNSHEAAPVNSVFAARLRRGRANGAAVQAAFSELYERGAVSAQMLENDCELTLADDCDELDGYEAVLTELFKSAGDGKRVLLSELETMAKKRGFKLKNTLLDFDMELDARMLDGGWYRIEELDAFGGRKLPSYITAAQAALFCVLAFELDGLWRMGALTYIMAAVWFAAYRITREYFRVKKNIVLTDRGANASAGTKEEQIGGAAGVFAQGLRRIADEAYSEISGE